MQCTSRIESWPSWLGGTVLLGCVSLAFVVDVLSELILDPGNLLKYETARLEYMAKTCPKYCVRDHTGMASGSRAVLRPNFGGSLKEIGVLSEESRNVRMRVENRSCTLWYTTRGSQISVGSTSRKPNSTFPCTCFSLLHHSLLDTWLPVVLCLYPEELETGRWLKLRISMLVYINIDL